MKQEYFVVVLAHSLRGRLRRVHVPHTAVYAVLGLALLGCFSAFGFVASYARMAWKVANYNALKSEADAMRARYQNLQKVVSETNVQMASLQLYAREVAVAYGIKQKLEGPSDISSEGKMVPSFTESLQEYNYLINADRLAIANRRSRRFGAPKSPPSLWPVMGPRPPSVRTELLRPKSKTKWASPRLRPLNSDLPLQSHASHLYC